jgi:glucose 1-dehydrogenase
MSGSQSVPTLDGKVVVITGSTRGLGLATAAAMLDAGASVLVTSRSPQAVERALADLADGGRPVDGSACDVGELGQVEALLSFALQRFGRVDVWINNAGVSAPYGPTAHVSTDSFEQVVRTNILGTYHGSVVALRHLFPLHRGKLINLLGRGDRQPVPLQNAYASSKAWVRNFTLAVAREYRDSGLGIFAFNPGLMFTSLIEGAEAVEGYEHRMRPLETVMRLWGQPPEVPAYGVQYAWWAASLPCGAAR